MGQDTATTFMSRVLQDDDQQDHQFLVKVQFAIDLANAAGPQE
jgi:hypothetical protein